MLLQTANHLKWFADCEPLESPSLSWSLPSKCSRMAWCNWGAGTDERNPISALLEEVTFDAILFVFLRATNRQNFTQHYAHVPHVIAQCVLKIEKLSLMIGTTLRYWNGAHLRFPFSIMAPTNYQTSPYHEVHLPLKSYFFRLFFSLTSKIKENSSYVGENVKPHSC